MHTRRFSLAPPSLEALADALRPPLEANFEAVSVSVVACPDLREPPFHLAAPGLSGDERAADVGGQPNLFPRPQLDRHWSLADIARAMEMGPVGSLIGAGAGPFHVLGQNCELAANVGWTDGLDRLDNQSRYAAITATKTVLVAPSPSIDCGLMANLFGSRGQPGPVLKVTARSRTGPETSLTECMQKALAAAYADSQQTISLGGVFAVKKGITRWHIMPDFPAESDLPFRDGAAVDAWLTYHDFAAPMVCLSLLHAADPHRLGLRMEHTHGFSPTPSAQAGGHYHYDTDGAVEYEGYFNTAKVLYRVDQPEEVVPR